MKLLIAVINKSDRHRLREALVENEVRFTVVSSTGGFLREGNVTMLIGVDDDRVETVLGLIAQHCHAREKTISMGLPDTGPCTGSVGIPITVPIGGAQVFILNVERVVHV